MEQAPRWCGGRGNQATKYQRGTSSVEFILGIGKEVILTMSFKIPFTK